MSISPLNLLSKDGFVRIAVEILGLFVGITVAYMIAIGPLLHSFAPGIYMQVGLDYSRTNLPDTTHEVTHLLLNTLIVGLFVYYRLYFTKLGQKFRDAIMEEY